MRVTINDGSYLLIPDSWHTEFGLCHGLIDQTHDYEDVCLSQVYPVFAELFRHVLVVFPEPVAIPDVSHYRVTTPGAMELNRQVVMQDIVDIPVLQFFFRNLTMGAWKALFSSLHYLCSDRLLHWCAFIFSLLLREYRTPDCLQRWITTNDLDLDMLILNPDDRLVSPCMQSNTPSPS